MKLQNISNDEKDICLFIRNDDKSLTIKEDHSFLPYYFEPTTDEKSDAISIYEEPLKKICCNHPEEVRKQRSSRSYEADIIYTKRYILDKIPIFEKSLTRIIYFDIEVQASELPQPKEEQKANDSVSVITIYDNYTQKYKTSYLKDYNSEFEMLDDFCQTIKKLQPDVMCAWNSEFDYYYLYYRIPNFPKKISCINKSHWRKGFEMPAGISIVDFMGLYAKYTLHKKDSYTLMNVANDELNYEIETDFDFTNVELSKEKNILDVKKMVELDAKLKLFDYFDEIRLLTRADWEDLPSEMRAYQWQSNNSKLIDMLALEEAKKLNIILPSKHQENEKGNVEGAYRDTFGTGLFRDLAKVDLSGAYPQAIIDFCLSPENYKNKESENTTKIEVLSRETKELKNRYYIEQNPNAILPVLTSRLLNMKNELKKKLNSLEKDTDEYKQCQIAYDSRKALVNSAFGVFGMPYFRLYNSDVADTITFLVRDLLHYVEDKLRKNSYDVRYIDTDSVFYQGKTDITNKLNKWAVAWGIERYNNFDVNIQFDYEGYFSSIFVQAMCRYRGRLETTKGQKIETKGIQMKRRDSSEWVKSWQEKLYDKILDGESKESVIKFIEESIQQMQEEDVRKIALPVKINKKIEDYKTTPKWLKPLEETKKIIPDFDKSIGDRFYIIYCKSVEKLALGNKHYKHIRKDNIDWKAMIEKNIFNLLVPIFKGLNWGIDLLNLAESYEVILGSQHRNKLLESFPIQEYNDLKVYYSARQAKKRIKEKCKTIEPKSRVRKNNVDKSLKTKKISKKNDSISSIKKKSKSLDKQQNDMLYLNKDEVINWD